MAAVPIVCRHRYRSPQQGQVKMVFCGHFRVHLHKCLFLDGLLWARGSQVSSLQAFVEAIS